MILAGISIYIWLGVLAVVLGIVAVDLGIFHRDGHSVKVREALIWTGVWFCCSLIFNLLLYLFWDQVYHVPAGMDPEHVLSRGEASMAFLAGYLIEQALSVDNIFVFLVVFKFFHVPSKYQHRVLFYGIIGALVFRAIFIALGAAVLSRFEWMMVIFGAFLVYTGIKIATQHGAEVHPEKNPVLKLFGKVIPLTKGFHDHHFFIREGAGKLVATPLFATLVMIEVTDIIFAVDSIPAIFAVTKEPFIVFTSNVFAILGLRSLFFALSGMMGLFRFLSHGLSAVLIFVGGKMLYGYAEHSLMPDWPKLPTALSLAVIVIILGGAVLASVWWPKKDEGEATEVK